MCYIDVTSLTERHSCFQLISYPKLQKNGNNIYVSSTEKPEFNEREPCISQLKLFRHKRLKANLLPVLSRKFSGEALLFARVMKKFIFPVILFFFGGGGGE